jgi:phospholipid N-methyltransferase
MAMYGGRHRRVARPEEKATSYALFAAEALGDYSTTANIVPSSRHLARAMLEPLQLEQASVVVELGPGTGAITRALLELMPSHSKLIAFELNPRFCRYLRRTLTNPRLAVLNASAEKVGWHLRQLGCRRVDAVVSSLGLSLMSDQQRKAILRELLPYFDENSIFTQYQYLGSGLGDVVSRSWERGRSSVPRLLRQHFGSVHTKTVWLNLPPAVVFTCKK